MRWKRYSEARGKPPDCEVVITFDASDADHPFLKRRVAAYQAEGKAVVLRPAQGEGRRQGARAGRGGSSLIRTQR